ncbi:MAG: DUF349 domain-containing protein [Bacteroidaceae bacterium]|nr:DUF349 domain-containing protein [Bacteroidaceae bacterium]
MMNSTENNELTQQEPTKPVYSTKAAVIERLKEIVQEVEGVSKSELDSLKQIFYKLHVAEQEKLHKEFLEQGGDPAAYVPAIDESEVTFKAEMNLIKEKRNAYLQEQEQLKVENLQKKQAIIDRIKGLAENPDEANQAYEEVKNLQTEWKNIGVVPPENSTELWKTYQLYIEKYYDTLKISNEFREYDFKKNLETKVALCEAAEKLAEEEDVIAAFHKLQSLHQEFRDCGPVAKEQREEIWKRFKDASTTVNRRHQQHFENIKNEESKNLEKKTAICETIEGIDVENITSAPVWNEMTQKVIELQTEWKKIGFAPQKMNVKIFERFRAACDKFFTAKSEFFKGLKDNLAQNLELKTALCEKAEQLKDSTDWKKTSDALIRLQKEWKTIGPVAKKESDAVWKRFVAACDYFFEQKEKVVSTLHNEEHENLKKKQEIIEKLKTLATEKVESSRETLQALTKEWNEVGHVPFKEKDKLYEEYKNILDNVYKQLNAKNGKKRLNKFKDSIKERIQDGNNLLRERDRLFRIYENMKSEIKTYENNLGFLNSSSKSGNGLLAEIKRKVEKLKDDLELQKQKIQTLDEEINKSKKSE